MASGDHKPRTMAACVKRAKELRAATDRGSYRPTAEVIAARCRELQRGWTVRQREIRSEYALEPYDFRDHVVVIGWPGSECFDDRLEMD